MSRLETAKDPPGNETAWSYDAAGNKLTETRPETGSTISSYNVVNQVLTNSNPAHRPSKPTRV